MRLVLVILCLVAMNSECRRNSSLKPGPEAFVTSPCRIAPVPRWPSRVWRLPMSRSESNRVYAKAGNELVPIGSKAGDAFRTFERFAIETWREHGDTVVLAIVYGIRVLRFFIMLRNLLEWLPQVNPYLPPFDTIYQLTDVYLGIFKALVPPISGVEVSGAVAMHLLQQIESLLAHRPNVAQQAL